jgi:hypothetical protein
MTDLQFNKNRVFKEVSVEEEWLQQKLDGEFDEARSRQWNTKFYDRYHICDKYNEDDQSNPVEFFIEKNPNHQLTITFLDARNTIESHLRAMTFDRIPCNDPFDDISTFREVLSDNESNRRHSTAIEILEEFFGDAETKIIELISLRENHALALTAIQAALVGYASGSSHVKQIEDRAAHALQKERDSLRWQAADQSSSTFWANYPLG